MAETNHQLINVSSKRPPGHFSHRIRKVLRESETCRIGALGMAISTLVDVAEMLKRDDVGRILSVETSRVLMSRDDGRPLAKDRMDIVMGRGEMYRLLEGYRGNRIGQVFAKLDSECCGTVPVEQLKAAGMGEGDNVQEAKEYLVTLRAQGLLNVPLKEFSLFYSILLGDSVENETFDQFIDSLLG